MIIELLLVYKYAFILCLVAGFVLSTQGIHMIARRESLELLALSQATVVGYLAGKVILFQHNHNEEFKLFLTSLFFFIITKLFFSTLRRFKQLTSPFFMMVYLVFMALSYLLISIFPVLESHMALALFGDIVSITDQEAIFFIGILIVLGIVFQIFRKQLIRNTLEYSIFNSSRIHWPFELLFAGVMVVSLYNFGLLFSLSIIMIPTVILGNKGSNFEQTLWLIQGNAALALTLGLAMSISYPRLSTVPTQILFLLAGSLIAVQILKIKNPSGPGKRG